MGRDSSWEIVQKRMSAELQGKISGLVLDMDGVLYRGEQALAGARELLPALRAAKLSFIMLTNNATLTSGDFAAKLARMGVFAGADAILTSSGATALYLARNYPQGGGVYIVGEAGLIEAVTSTPGFYTEAEQPDFVVVGLDRHFTYNAMQKACSAIRRGARFIATNTDTTLPVEGGDLWPGAGSIVAAIQTCSGVAPTVIGKPNVYIAGIALEKLGLPAGEVLCVGDRLETDILMGARAGMPTALLLSGVSTREEIATSEAQPTYVYAGLPELMVALDIASMEQPKPHIEVTT